MRTIFHTTEEIHRFLVGFEHILTHEQRQAIEQALISEKDFGGVTDVELKEFLHHLEDNKAAYGHLSREDVLQLKKILEPLLQ